MCCHLSGIAHDLWMSDSSRAECFMSVTGRAEKDMRRRRNSVSKIN